MGVTQLWQILAPVQQHSSLSTLAGQLLAVDLSIWVCETQSVKQMQGVVSKPFLRISHLTQLGVKLVFVVEGSAPELKWEAMMKRQQARFPERQGRQPQHRQGRRNFNKCLKECCEMLDILGIPYVQSQGEAEAMCAVLNAAGLVDGCLTNDGDAFLYGATVVYRNFTMNSKDPHVESYKMSEIESELGIDRNGLVALGLLLGCDYVPKGVPGIGHANAVKLMQTLRGRNVLKRLKEWRHLSETDCLDQVEILMRRKAMGVSEFPQEKVMKEFLVSKDKCPRVIPCWKRPIINQMQDFALDKLEWPVEYSLEKVLPLVTLWDMQDIIRSRLPSSGLHLKPHRIVKTRVRQGVPCYEVEWHKPVTDTTCPDDYYITIEEQKIFSQSYQQIVDDFNASQEEKKAKKTCKGTRKKKKESEEKEDPQGSASVFTDVSAESKTCHITEELEASLVKLKISDPYQSAKNNRNTCEDSAGRGSKNVTKHCKAKKLSPTAITESREMIEPIYHGSQHFSSVSDINIDEENSEITETHCAQHEHIPTLNDSSDDTYMPLSMRVKQKLQKKKEDKSNHNNKVITVLNIKHSDLHEVQCANLITDINQSEDSQSIVNCVSTEIRKIENLDVNAEEPVGIVIRTDNINHPHQSPDKNLGLPTNFLNDCASDSADTPVYNIVDIHQIISETADNSMLVKCKTLQSTIHDFQTNRHTGAGGPCYVSPSSGTMSQVNTPLSCQKEFLYNEYNRKVSSPLLKEFCSPITYMKQTLQKPDETDSIIEIQDSPFLGKPELMLDDTANDAQSKIDEKVIAITNCTVNNLAMNETEFQQNQSSGNHKLCESYSCHSKLSAEQTRNLRAGHQSETADSLLNTTPLYSEKNYSGPKTNYGPYQLILKNKLEISQTSVHDFPDFEIQTSLLNSLCKTFDQTASPFAVTKHEHSLIQSSDSALKDLETLTPENVCNSNENMKLQANGLLYGKADVGICIDTKDFVTADLISDGQNKSLVETHFPVTTDLKQDLSVLDNIHTKVVDIKATRNMCDCDQMKKHAEKQLKVECTLHIGKKYNNESKEIKQSLVAANTRIGRERKTFSKELSEVDSSRKTLRDPITSSALNSKKSKRKVRGKVKKSGVKKVSACMNLSHDSDEDIILSQMILSQEMTDVNSEKYSCIPLEAKHLYDVANKENNLSSSASGKLEDYKGTMAVKQPKVLKEVSTAFRETSSINELDIKAKKNLEYVNIDSFDEEIDSAVVDRDCYSIGASYKSVESKFSENISSKIAAPSPISLADRLKKKLTNSSTRQVLTDFTQSHSSLS